MAIDPVCKMNIEEASAQHKTAYQGKTYYFCAAACKNAFETNPELGAKADRIIHFRDGKVVEE